jgi:hypothetical protein
VYNLLCSLYRLNYSAVLAHLFMILFFYYLVYRIKCSQCLMFYSLYIIICSLCLIFVRKNNYLFVLLKYLFPVVETNYLVLKNIMQI